MVYNIVESALFADMSRYMNNNPTARLQRPPFSKFTKIQTLHTIIVLVIRSLFGSVYHMNATISQIVEMLLCNDVIKD